MAWACQIGGWKDNKGVTVKANEEVEEKGKNVDLD